MRGILCVLGAMGMLLSASAIDVSSVGLSHVAERESLSLLRRALPSGVSLWAGDRELDSIRVERSSSLAPEEYSAEVVGDALYLRGGDARGVFYSVCAFLERSLGVRVWNPWEQQWPSISGRHVIQAPSWRVRPAFAMRDIYNDYFAREDSGFFAAFNRVNHYGEMWIAAKHGGSVRFGRPYFVHTFNHYITEKEYFASHPEYFALLKGKRVPGPGSQLCLSNPEVLRVMVAKLRKNIELDRQEAQARNLPWPVFYDISANDNNKICSCENCRRIIEEEGEESGLVLRFVNQVAKAIGQDYPDIRITTLAYMNTERPPRHERPASNVVIRLCNTSINNFSGILSPENHVFRDKVRRWRDIGAQLYVWQYSVFYAMPSLPYPSEYDYPEVFQYFRKNNVTCLFMEHEFPEQADMHTYKSYLEAKLMEDPTCDFKALRRDFLRGYYGKAAPMIEAYRDLLRQSAVRKRSFGFNYNTSTGSFDFLDGKTAAASATLLDQAATAVAGDKEKLRRVQRVRLNLDRAIYILCRRWGTECEALPAELDRDAALKRAREVWSAAIPRVIREQAHASKRGVMEAELKKFSQLPARVPRLPELDRHPRGIDYLPELINVHGHALVLDEESSTGYAVRVTSPLSHSLFAGGYVVPENRHQNTQLTPAGKITQSGYHWYKALTFDPEPGGYLYLLKDWTVQIPQDTAASRKKPGEKWSLYVRAKFEGLNTAQGIKALMIDRVMVVPETRAGAKQ